MELHAVQVPFGVLHGGGRAQGGVSGKGKALRRAMDKIGVAHQHPLFRGQIAKEAAALFQRAGHGAVFAAFAGPHLAAQGMGHELHAVADAQHGYAQIEYPHITGGMAWRVDAVRTAGKDQADGPGRSDALNIDVAGPDLGIDAQFAHAAGDQLLVLTAKIQNDDDLLHDVSSLHKITIPTKACQGWRIIGARGKLRRADCIFSVFTAFASFANTITV